MYSYIILLDNLSLVRGKLADNQKTQIDEAKEYTKLEDKFGSVRLKFTDYLKTRRECFTVFNNEKKRPFLDVRPSAT